MDRLYHRAFEATLGLMRADPANVDPGTRILFAAHYLERIGDRVTNIAEDIVFLATGEIEDPQPVRPVPSGMAPYSAHERWQAISATTSRAWLFPLR